MRNTKWNIKPMPTDKDISNDILSLNIDNDILKLLYSRGLKNSEEIKKFLHPQLENINDPYGLVDLAKSVKIIKKAIKENKNIWIYGDYDVDGITSTSVLYLSLKELGAKNVNYYIPIRDEGYGLNNEALKKIKDSGADIVITVDCGITAFSEIEYANSIDLPIIITDHHNLQGDDVPNAIAVVNPKRKENTFPFEYLAGVGTVFMLILALFESYDKKNEAYKYLDLVAIGTIADIVPLTDDNRILTKFGLEQLTYSRNKGLNYLLYKLFNSNGNNNANGQNNGQNNSQYNGQNNSPNTGQNNNGQLSNKSTSRIFTPKTEYTTYDVGFIIAPVFNAAGRLKDAKMVVKLLISDNNREIEIIVKELINKNFERKELQNNIISMVEKNIEEKGIKDDYVIVDYSPEYHHGVIGIAASKIVDTYYKPTIIMEIKEDEGIGVGSCRSIEGFNILEALQSMPELFVKFGGHSGAAGFTIPIKNINLFSKKINEFAKNKLKIEDFVKVISIDKQIPIQKISYEFFKVTELLKPFGFGNPSPTFLTKNVLLENVKFIGESKNHIMFDFKQKGFQNKNAVWFNSGEYFKELNKDLFYDIVYKLKLEDFQNRYYTKVYIDDIKKSSLKDDTLFYYHSMFTTSFPQKSIFYTNLDLDKDIPLTTKIDFDQISLFQGRKFIGRLDYNISNLLIQLQNYYNWNFNLKIENITKSTSHNIVDILIKRDYSFKCFDYTEVGIFNKIKEFLIGKMEYNSVTKKLLGSYFRDGKNLIILNEKNRDNLNNFLLTLGIYYFQTMKSKSSIYIDSASKFDFSNINMNFMKNYFEFNKNEISKIIHDSLTDSKQPDSEVSIFFINKITNEFKAFLEKEFIKKQKRFCVVLNSNAENGFSENSFFENNINEKNDIKQIFKDSNIEFIQNSIIIPENINFLNNIKKSEIKDIKNSNIYLEYLPFSEKIKLKSKLEKNETVYSDNSIFEIL